MAILQAWSSRARSSKPTAGTLTLRNRKDVLPWNHTRLEAVPGCPGLQLDLDDIRSEIARLEASQGL